MPTLSIEALRSFALERHATQKYGVLPYAHHLDQVAAVARTAQLGPVYVRAAYGHDLLEDTQTTMLELLEHFGEAEAALIYSVTGQGPNREARRLDTIERLNQHPPGINLKMADRACNLAHSLEEENHKLVAMYLSEEPAYAALFAQGKDSLQRELASLYKRAAQCSANRRPTYAL